MATELVDLEAPGPALRVAVDGPRVADPGGFAAALVVSLRALGKPVTHIRSETFWRDAALRLEYGRTDLQSFATSWLDDAAIRREVLDRLGPCGDGRFLPFTTRPGVQPCDP